MYIYVLTHVAYASFFTSIIGLKGFWYYIFFSANSCIILFIIHGMLSLAHIISRTILKTLIKYLGFFSINFE